MAIRHYTKAVELNPFSMRSQIQLSKLGHDPSKHVDLESAIQYTQSNNKESFLFTKERREIVVKKPMIVSNKRVKKGEDSSDQSDKVNVLLTLIDKHIHAFTLTSSFESSKAIQAWKKLDQVYFQSSFVYTQMAIAYYHASQYKEVTPYCHSMK